MFKKDPFIAAIYDALKTFFTFLLILSLILVGSLITYIALSLSPR